MTIYQKLFSLCFFLCLFASFSMAEGKNNSVRVISESSNSSCSINYYSRGETIKYKARIYKQEEGSVIFRIDVLFESDILYTSAYLTDNLLILTNNKTNRLPIMSVINFEKKVMNICKLEELPKGCSTISRSRVCCTPSGCMVVDVPLSWHNDEWTKYETGVILRLGDTIPNRCTVMWRYDYTCNRFFLTEGMNCRSIVGCGHVIIISYSRMSTLHNI